MRLQDLLPHSSKKEWLERKLHQRFPTYRFKLTPSVIGPTLRYGFIVHKIDPSGSFLLPGRKLKVRVDIEQSHRFWHYEGVDRMVANTLLEALCEEIRKELP